MVAYLGQFQWSSLMLDNEALMPPCAATVCDRVGKTLESTATDKPACASCREQRMPAPPAPTTTTSNWRRGMDFLTAATVYKLQRIFTKYTEPTNQRMVSTSRNRRTPVGLA